MGSDPNSAPRSRRCEGREGVVCARLDDLSINHIIYMSVLGNKPAIGSLNPHYILIWQITTIYLFVWVIGSALS